MNYKKILITGGSRGIGHAIVQKLQNPVSEIHSVSRSLSVHSVSNHVQHQCDLSSINQAEVFLENFIKDHGVPDLLINNAGSGAFFEWGEFPTDEVERQINLLFTVPILFSRSFAPLMAEENKGTIVNISSLATLYPLPFMPLYNAGKTALSSFTQSMMLEYQNHPKFIDFRLGDICSEFNNAQNKQSEGNWTEKMKSAWKQIEKQLLESPKPEIAALQVQKIIAKEKSGVFYGGGFFQSKIAPRLRILLNQRGLLFLLHNRYFK
jgi:short-subunit dehydrogenase